jgi:hypothetical protein
VGEGMKEDGEPDAGDLHVRFDGREVETGKGMEGPQNRGRRTGAEDDRKVGDGISLLLFSNTTWISLHRATSRPYSTGVVVGSNPDSTSEALGVVVSLGDLASQQA